MAIEDLFKIVKERFVADQPAAPANSGGDVEIPQDLLFKCPRCGAVVYNREFTAAMKVCPKCNKPTRPAHKFAENGAKLVVCKHCGETL